MLQNLFNISDFHERGILLAVHFVEPVKDNVQCVILAIFRGQCTTYCLQVRVRTHIEILRFKTGRG